jgi:hypothetical protein
MHKLSAEGNFNDACQEAKKNLPLVKISVGMCASLAKRAKWLITFQLVRERGSKGEKLFLSPVRSTY